MCTFEYISLDDDFVTKGTAQEDDGRKVRVSGRLSSESKRAQGKMGDGQTHQNGSRRFSHFFKNSLRKRFLLGAAVVAVGTAAAWTIHGSVTGEPTWGRRIFLQHDAGRQADLLMLVNKDNPLDESYAPMLHWLNNGSCAVAQEMYEPLKEMLTDGSEQGLEFVVASGYRDRAYQQQLLDEDIDASMAQGLTWEEAYEKETRETMPPGYSEHGTGLAVDIAALDYQVLDEYQESTAENMWLRENCSKYGFILRYPKGSEHITGIDYESWHFRYVGKEAAQEIMQRGITLEEFLGEA